jgi:hypothetical protein
VKPSFGERLINVCRQVNGREILFVKGTGAEMTLVREEYVDSSNIIEGQRVTLYTAVGQPFTAKMAAHSTISFFATFSIPSFCLLLDLVTTYVLDFPKISILNRASAVMFATNPTVACPLKYGVSKLRTAIFAMVECEVHSQDLNEDVDLIDFSEPDEEIQEEIDIEYVNELPEQGESIGLEHLSNVNVDTLSRL